MKNPDLEFFLDDNMYQIDQALEKILADRNLEQKLLYIEKLLDKKSLRSSMKPYANPLEVHCAVVCCDVKERKVMITHRGKQHTTNPEKWEFGCAKLSSDKKMIRSIEEYYKETFGVEIELVIDNDRSEKQPLPIAVYEINNEGNIKKGIIFVGKVQNRIESQDFRAEKYHDSVKWIGEHEIDQYKDNAVSDFEDTLTKVFSEFDNFFGKVEGI